MFALCFIQYSIWDMIDQGLRSVDTKTGETFFAYGGDYGEPIHDAQFCINVSIHPSRLFPSHHCSTHFYFILFFLKIRDYFRQIENHIQQYGK